MTLQHMYGDSAALVQQARQQKRPPQLVFPQTAKNLEFSTVLETLKQMGHQCQGAEKRKKRSIMSTRLTYAMVHIMTRAVLCSVANVKVRVEASPIHSKMMPART